MHAAIASHCCRERMAALVLLEEVPMVRGRDGKSRKKKPEGSAASAGHDAAQSSSSADGRKPLSKKDARIEKARRKQLKRLEVELSAAAKTEARRVRKLEKARWRRQKLQAAVVEANSKGPNLPTAEARPKQAAAKSRSAKSSGKASTAGTSKAAATKATGRKQPKSADSSTQPSAASSGSAPTTAADAPGAASSAAEPAADPAAGAAVEAYCLREKKRVTMLDPKPVVTANGAPALTGTCPSCGAALYKLVGRKGR